MARISDRDRSMIFNCVDMNSDQFTEHEIEQIHEIALKLDEIRKTIWTREDNRHR